MVESSQFWIFVCHLKYSAKPLTCTHIMNSNAVSFLPSGNFSWLRKTERLKAGEMSSWSWFSLSTAQLLIASHSGDNVCWEHEGLLHSVTALWHSAGLLRILGSTLSLLVFSVRGTKPCFPPGLGDCSVFSQGENLQWILQRELSKIGNKILKKAGKTLYSWVMLKGQLVCVLYFSVR